MHDVRARVVSAFHATATEALSCGDRPLQEHLDQLAAELGHHNTSDRVLAAFLRHIADQPTTKEQS